jgi:hypothetical protein
MKQFFHPSGKSGKVTTSKGSFDLDAKGSAMVEDEMFDHLMKIPTNSAYQAKLSAQESPEAIQEKAEAEQKRLEEEKKAEEERLRLEAEKNNSGLKEEDLKLLDIKELKAIAGKRKIKFSKDIAPEDLIFLILNTKEAQE